MTKPVLIILSLATTIVALSVIQVIVSTRLSTSGVELADIQNTTQALKNSNVLLSEELVQSSSLTQIASGAATLGFVDSKSEVYISDSLPIAKR